MPLTDEELAAKIARTGNAKDAFITQDLKEALEELSDRASSGGVGAVDSVNGDTGVVVLTQDDIADGATYKQFSQTEKTKLSGVATNAELRDRTTHTGVQAISTVTGLQSALDSKVATDGSKVLSDVNFSTAKDEKLNGIPANATENDTDAELRDRSTHTGTQAISTISSLQFSLDLKADLVDGKVPASQLPAYVDDIVEYADLASFPGTGAAGILYLALDTDIVYRWSGSTYIDIGSSSLALGETSSTAYRGDRGKTAYEHSQLTGNVHSLSMDTITDGTTNRVFTQTEKTKLSGISDGATANSSDAALRGRSTHTGVQDISTITGLQTALDSKVTTDGSKVLSDVNFSTAKDAKLTGIATGATVNSPDATLLARSNHTGTQAISTVTGLQTALDSKVATDGSKVLSDVNFSTALNSKLSGIAVGATANSSDATLLARANHTGTQLAATISNFNSAALSAAPAETATTLGAITTGATAKTEAVDTDSIGITDSAASNIWKKLSLLNLWHWIMRNIMSWFGWFNVKYYGATGDGTTVDDTSFQNCFNAAILAHGKVIIPSPSNFYNITTTIQVYPNASSTGADNEVNVDVEATGTPRFLIKYSGTTGTSCFDINGLRYSKWSGVSVLLADTTNLIGFDLDTKSAASSLSNNNFYSCNTILGNATGQIGWRIGQTSANGGDFSSLAWYNCQVYGVNKSVTGTIGWHVKGSNALQNKWDTMFGANLDKMYSNSGGGNGGVTFDNAGTSQCNLDFEISNNQTYTWSGGRFESGERAIHVTNSNVSPSLTFTGSEWNDYTPSDGILFYIDMPCSIALIGCNVQTGPTESEYTANMFKLYGGGEGTGTGRLIVIGGSYEAADPMYDHSGNSTNWSVYIMGVGRQNSTGVNTLMMTDIVPDGTIPASALDPSDFQEFDPADYYTALEVDDLIDGLGEGTGNVSKAGTPANNQVAIWTDDGIIEGDAGLTWNESELIVSGTIRLSDNTTEAAFSQISGNTFIQNGNGDINVNALTNISLKTFTSAAFNEKVGISNTGVVNIVTAPTTSAGSHDILTRNTSTGVVEKITSASLKAEVIAISMSDLTTAITTGTSKAYFRMPWAGTLTGVKATALTAPTGSTIIIDINEAGTTVLSTKLSIDATEKTSTTAASAAVISDSALADDAEITLDFDQVGSTIAGAGVIVYLYITRA